MKILILGARGNLGGQLIKVFQGDEILAWDRDEIDIIDKDLITRKLKEIKPELVVNVAAYNAVDKCEEDDEYEKAKKVNGLALGYLADACLEIGATLVHYSSDYVFGGDKVLTEKAKEDGGFSEDDKPAPTNRYGETKLMGEKEIISRSGRGLKWYLIRTSKLFGPKGESDMAKPGFFDIMLDLSSKRSELDVIDDEVSCFTYTRDLAEATKSLVKEGAGYGVYHIINTGACTWYQGARELFHLAGKVIKVNAVGPDKFPRPAKRPSYSVLKNTKLPSLRSYQIALRDYLKNK